MRTTRLFERSYAAVLLFPMAAGCGAADSGTEHPGHSTATPLEKIVYNPDTSSFPALGTTHSSPAAPVDTLGKTDVAPAPVTGASVRPVQPELGAPGRDEVPKGTWRKSEQSNAETFGWSANDWDVPMKPVTTHACFLTKVQGELGGNSAVAVHRSAVPMQLMYLLYGLSGGSGGTLGDDTSDTWQVGGWQDSAGNSLSAEGTCVPISDFSADPGGVIWMSNSVWQEAHSGWPGCNTTHFADLWSNFAVSMVMGVRGDFEGGGEVVQVIGSNSQADPAAVSQLRVHSEQCGSSNAIEGRARSLFVGTPQQTWGTLRTERFSVGTQGGPKRAQMRLTRDAVCYLTKVSGQMDGAPESISIHTEKDALGKEWWWLEVKKGNGKAYAEAECLYYHQETHTVE